VSNLGFGRGLIADGCKEGQGGLAAGWRGGGASAAGGTGGAEPWRPSRSRRRGEDEKEADNWRVDANV
jgi:hypothetical protein